jgi:hypothetical protein
MHVCPDDVNATFLLHGQLILQNFVNGMYEFFSYRL